MAISTRFTSLIGKLHKKMLNQQFWKRQLKAITTALSPSVSVKSLLLRKKRGDRDPALKVTDDGRGQRGHLQT